MKTLKNMILATVARHAYHEGLAVASLDFAKAYQSMRRGAIAKGLQEYCPELLPLFKALYGTSSHLRANTADERGALVGLSSTGCKQGDPLSTLFFCVGLQASLLEIQTRGERLLATRNFGSIFYLLGFADDLQIIGPPLLVQHLASYAAEVTKRCGLTFNKAKSNVLVKRSPETRSSTDLSYIHDAPYMKDRKVLTDEFKTAPLFSVIEIFRAKKKAVFTETTK